MTCTMLFRIGLHASLSACSQTKNKAKITLHNKLNLVFRMQQQSSELEITHAYFNFG